MAEQRAQEIVTNRDVVQELILKSFLVSGVAEQRLLVQQNRPHNRSLTFKAMGERFINSGMRERLVVWNSSKARSVLLAVLTF